MKKILRFIFILSFLVLFPFIVQATCVNPVYPSDEAIDIDPSVPITLDWCDEPGANSYYVRVYDAGNISLEGGVTIDSKIIIPGWYGVFTGDTTYQWEFAACANNDFTKCGADCDDKEPVSECADYNGKWSFTTEDIGLIPPKLLEPFYDPSKPTEIPVINLSYFLKWQSSVWAHSYIYELKENVNEIIGTTITNSHIIAFDSVWDLGLEPNTEYSWYVKSCYNEDGTNCSEFSEPWFFKTTGAPPNNLTINNAIIPVKLDWDDVNDAISYTYEVSANNSFSEEQIVASDNISRSEATVDYYPDNEDYPGLVQDTQYWWRAKSCADKQGNYCGDWSTIYGFTTFLLSAPCVFDGILNESCPYPEVGGGFYVYQKNISWQSVEGAKAYKYKIDYASKNPQETDEGCVAGQPVVEVIALSNSAHVSLHCLGTYNWWLQSCLDENCSETSELSPVLNFTLVRPVLPAQFGLVPCGRISDNPETQWDERDPCEIKHIFLLLKNIIDFVLWRVGLIALALLMMFTAVVSYFSLGSSGTVVSVKQIWQRAGKGYMIMFLAWWIINTIMKIIGFTDTWWSLPF